MRTNEFRVLLIDDDEDDFINIRDILEEAPRTHYRLKWKASYREGLDSLRGESYDACLLDYRLGAQSGLDLLSEAQQMGIACPIILLTGQGDFELDVLAMEIGAAEYLVKGHLTAPLLERSIRYAMKHALDMQELNENKEIFKALFDTTFEGIIVHNQGAISDVNKSARQIFGYDYQDMVGRPILDFIQSIHEGVVEEKIFLENVESYEAMGCKKDGNQVSIEISSRMVNLRGQRLSLVTILDLTEKKQMQEKINHLQHSLSSAQNLTK